MVKKQNAIIHPLSPPSPPAKSTGGEGNAISKLVAILFCMSVFWLVLVNPSYAQPTASSELATLLNSVQSMQANFVQKIYDNHGKMIQQSVGKMAMQRPGKFRWEVKKPIPQLIIANDTRLWIYDADLEQVTIRALQQTTGDTPALLLSHSNVALEHDYHVQALPSRDASFMWYQLKPKNPDNVFLSVQMGFMNRQIREMHLEDHLGHTTVIQFKEAKLNAPIPATLFTFTPPKNVDVIDETRKKG